MLYTYGRWKIPLATLTQLGRMRLSTPPSVSRRSQCIKVPGDSTVLGSISRVWCYGIISSLQTREVPSWSPSIPEANRSRALEGSTQAAQHEPNTLVYAFWLPQLKYATRSEVCVRYQNPFARGNIGFICVKRHSVIYIIFDHKKWHELPRPYIHSITHCIQVLCVLC